MDVELELWDFALSARGDSFIGREFKKAKVSVAMIGRIEQSMLRLERGEASAKEYDLVEKGLYELRINGDGRWYRLLYGRDAERYVALQLVVKKQNKLDRNDIATARKRLAEHLR